MTKIKYALVLSGGGFKGIFQVAALNFVKENKLVNPDFHFDIIAGISAGALNGAMVACQKFDLLKALWQQVKENGASEIFTSPFIDPKGNATMDFEVLQQLFFPGFRLKLGLWKGLQLLLSKKKRMEYVEEVMMALKEEVSLNMNDFLAIASNQPLEEKLKKHLNVKHIPAHTQFTCGYVSLTNGSYYAPLHTEYSSNKDFINGVLASTAMPIVWKPVEKIYLNSQTAPLTHLVDGGLRTSSPLGDVLRLIEADPEDCIYKILIINNNSGDPGQMPGKLSLGNIAMRSLTEITLAEIFNNDLREFIRINELVRQAEEKGVTLRKENGQPFRRFHYKIIQPKGAELGSTMDTRKSMIDTRERLGLVRAKEAFAQADPVNWPLL